MAHSPHGITAVGSLMGLHIPVCDVADAQRAQEEAQVHAGLEEVDLPRVVTHQIKLRVTPWSEGQKHKTVCKSNHTSVFSPDKVKCLP